MATASMRGVDTSTGLGYCMVFRTALLLTGDARHAESAIIDAISAGDSNDLSPQSIFSDVVKAAVSPGREMPAQEAHPALALSILPPELRPVLLLSRSRRHCFVLRVLAGLSREECCRLLQMDVRQIDEECGEAARELARSSAIQDIRRNRALIGLTIESVGRNAHERGFR